MHLSNLLVAGLAFVTEVSAHAGSKFIQHAQSHTVSRAAHLESLRATTKNTNTSSYRYLNAKTKPYQVTSLPDFNFDIGEFYSGSVPIDAKNRTLFFAFKPTTGPKVDEVTIWLNGGPGCSSLAGLIDENGPWTWQPGTYLPVQNPYAWSNLTNMLWVEQPVGTGFSQGQVRARSEEDLAADFVLFFKNFQKTFGISNYKIFITGESYAGRYVPFIAQAMLQQNDTKLFNLKGGMIYDPVIGDSVTQFDATIAPFAEVNQLFLNLNSSTQEEIRSLDEKCGFAAYREKYFTFPPPSSQPSGGYKYPAGTNENSCDIFDLVANSAQQVNPCFNIYSVNTQCPLLWDVTGFPGGHEYLPKGATIYFNRADVKKAMHAPQNVQWEICKNGVLLDDTSADSAVKAIPDVIAATNRFLIANGDYDMILTTNGTLFAIQNMTWGGKTGFQERPSQPIVVEEPDLQWGQPGPQGVMGIKHYERGLMWAQTYQAGHMGPEAQPRVALRLLKWVLGRSEDI